jgi:hypothetical protein
VRSIGCEEDGRRPTRPVKEDAMQAHVGDRLVVHGRHVGDGERSGEIVEVRGTNGEPPYRVRWDNGVTDLIIPSSDASIQAANSN